MRIITCVLDYCYGEPDVVAHKIEKRIKLLESIGVVVPNEEKIDRATLALTEKQYIDLISKKENPNVLSVTEISDSIDSMTDKIADVATRFERFAEKIGNVQYNEKCEVYTPGAGLMLFNRVTLLTDACSDDLQAELDNGWRIIATCPQPDQRRPDYILGKYEPEYKIGAGNNARRCIEITV